jgi:hypothetical protein
LREAVGKAQTAKDNEDAEPAPAVEEPAEAAVGSAGGLEWTGDDEEGYLARALVEGKYPIAYIVVPVIFRGCEHFKAKIITDSDVDFALPVKQLADRCM